MKNAFLTHTAIAATLLTASALPTFAFAGDAVTVYFTRHAEKQDLLTNVVVDADHPTSDHFYQPDGKKGAEELNAFGEARAEALAEWFMDKGITEQLTHIYSSQKLRTRQTIADIAADRVFLDKDTLETYPSDDYMTLQADFKDGIQQFPKDVVAVNYENRYETIDSPSSSVDPTVNALLYDLQPGDVALVAMHSGTFYKILADIGIPTGDAEVDSSLVTDEGLFPKGGDNKISTFGDIWKIVIKDSVATVKWRKNLQFKKYKAAATYTP